MISDRRLRILYLPSWYPTIKDPQFAIFLKVQAEALALDHSVVVLPVPAPVSLLGGPRNWGNRVEVERNGTAVRTLRIRGPNYHPGWASAEERTLLRLYRLGLKEAIRLLGGPPDLIHAQVAWAGGYYGARLAQEVGCPLILTEHISRPALLLGNPRDREWFEVAMRSADIVMSVSPAQRDELRRVGIDREIVVTPNLIDTDLFSPGAKPPAPPIRLITVGHLIKRKGVEHLLHAVASLGREDLLVDIVGDGPLRNTLEQTATSLGISGQVTFHGTCSPDQVRDLLRRSHVYVSASLTESFGVAVIEAMSVGLPSVVTRSGGPETFLGPDEGVVVEPGDPSELERGLRAILDRLDRFEAQRLHQSVVDRFGIQAVTRRINEQYRRAMTRRTAPKPVSA